MSDDILVYFQKEISEFRKLGEQYIKEHPVLSGKVPIDFNNIDDPMITRLIEAFAYMTARVNQNIDKEKHNLIENLLNITAPHILLPIPARAIVQVKLEDNHEMPLNIKKDFELITNSDNNIPVIFRTIFNTEIIPYTIESITHDNSKHTSSLAMKMTPLSNNIDNIHIKLKKLRFSINSNNSSAYTLMKMLLINLESIKLKMANITHVLKNNHINLMGLDKEQLSLPLPNKIHSAFMMLTDFFCFPEKFLFFEIDIDDIDQSYIRNEFTIIFNFDISEPSLNKNIENNILIMNTIPVINLFNKIAEPIQYTTEHEEFHVIPSYTSCNEIEIYTIKNIKIQSALNEISSCPINSTQLHYVKDEESVYWSSMRKPRSVSEGSKHNGYDTYLTLTFNEKLLENTCSISPIECLCMNRNVNETLPKTHSINFNPLDHHPEGIFSTVCVSPIHPISYTHTSFENLSVLLSYMNLKLSSIVNTETLKNLLYIHNKANQNENNKLINMIKNVSMKPIFIRSGATSHFLKYRAFKVSITIVEDSSVSDKFILFSACLNYLFQTYCTINTLVITEIINDENIVIKKWGATCGKKNVL